MYTLEAMNRKLFWITAGLLCAAGLFFRLWNLGFGLPHSFYADEPEISEPAIKYTYEFKNILAENNYYKLIPVSFVYGTFPTYLLTLKVMAASKFMNLLHISFDKTFLYIIMRWVMVGISLLIAITGAIFYKKLFKDSFGALAALFLLALNWKLIVHAHYVNSDIILTLLLTLSFLFFYFASQKNFDNRNTVLSAVFFGLAAGTKFTALISLPMFLYIFISKKDLKALLGFCLTALAVFMATNPFSIIFFKDFSFRIYEMFFKEAGMVFDSVDYSPIKYLKAAAFILSLPIFLLSIIGITKALKKNGDSQFHIFLFGNILIYIIFYSIQSRRVDRWILPIIPVLAIYSSYAISLIKQKCPKIIFALLCIIFTSIYLINPVRLLSQFQKDTPKSASYKWSKLNIPQKETLLPYILVYTEEGLDPLNKLQGAKVNQFNVYVSENAQLFFPDDPKLYEYIIVSSRPMSNFKKPEVEGAYPEYAKRWKNFEETLQNESEFMLIKTFAIPKPSLIPLSDVFIYKNINYQVSSLASLNN